MTIGEKISNLRTERNLTQKQLSNMCGFSQSALNLWENGKRQPKLEHLQKISTALEVPIWILLGISKQDALLAYKSDDYNRTNYETFELSEVIKKDILYETQFNKLKESYNLLNSSGQKEAIKRVSELTEIPRYTKQEKPVAYVNAAHADNYADAPEELKQMEESIMDDENFQSGPPGE